MNIYFGHSLKRILTHFLRITIGIVFIFSAIAKILSIDFFELYIYSQQVAGFDLSALAARIIISAELFTGILLISNIYFKHILRLTIIILSFFSLFLLYKIIIKSSENCNCFGEFIKLNPTESLFKNIILTGALLLLRNNAPLITRFNKHILFSTIIITLITPVIISPPDFIYSFIYTKNQYNYSENDKLELSDSTLNYKEGKKSVVFLSMKCRFCKLAAQKISVIAEKHDIKDNIYFYFTGENVSKKFAAFIEESHSSAFKYSTLPLEEFIHVTDGKLPTIMFVENSYIRYRRGYRTLTENDFTSFFNK